MSNNCDLTIDDINKGALPAQPVSALPVLLDRNSSLLCAADGRKVIVQLLSQSYAAIGTPPTIEYWYLDGTEYVGLISELQDCGAAPTGLATEATLATIKPAIDLVKTAVDAGTAATDASKTALLAALSPLATEATLAQIKPAIDALGNGKTLADIHAALAPLATGATNATLLQVRDNIAALAASNTTENAALSTGLDTLHTDLLALGVKSDAVKASVDLVKIAVDATTAAVDAGTDQELATTNAVTATGASTVSAVNAVKASVEANTVAVQAVEAQALATKNAVDAASAAIVGALANKATSADVQDVKAQVTALITSTGLDSVAERAILTAIEQAALREYELGDWRGVVAITAGGDWAIGDNLSYRDAIDLTNGSAVPLSREWFNDTTQTVMAGGLANTDYTEHAPLATEATVNAIKSAIGSKNDDPVSVFDVIGASLLSTLKGLFEFLWTQRQKTGDVTNTPLSSGQSQTFIGWQIQIFAPTPSDTYSIGGVPVPSSVMSQNFAKANGQTTLEVICTGGQINVFITN